MEKAKTLPRLAALMFALLIYGGLVFVRPAEAQQKKYSSRVDGSLTVKSLVVVPMIDNVGGIYAGPLTEELYRLLDQDRQWNVAKATDLKADNPDVLEENPKRVGDLQKKYKVDAVLSGRILKSPKGITLKLSLIGGEDALPITSETIENYQGFETADLKAKLGEVFTNLKNHLPYQATVTSRQGQLVTVNIGKNHGARVGEDLLVVLIFKAERHPKFKFITSTEREILGKIKLSKVDDSVSFGSITTEMTANLIQPGFKIARDQFLNYPGVATAGGKVLTGLDGRPDQEVAFGNNPTEWKPIQRGSFGKFGFMLGVTQTALETSNASGIVATSDIPFAPTVKMDGEIWIDPNWQVNVIFEQLAKRFASGGAAVPENVNFQMQRLMGFGAYNFLANDEFFGPKFNLLVGFGKVQTFIDDTTPRLHTSKDYSSMAVGLGGSIPFETEGGKRMMIGGRFIYHYAPGLSESPVSSGDSTNLVSDFMIFGEYAWTERMSFRADLEFKQLSSSFSGGAVNSSSANFTGVLGGISYQF